MTIRPVVDFVDSVEAMIVVEEESPFVGGFVIVGRVSFSTLRQFIRTGFTGMEVPNVAPVF